MMTFGAAAIRGLTGFGMAIILVPLLGLIIRPDKAVVLAIILQLLIGPIGFRKILADSHRTSATLIAIAAIFATPLGIWLLSNTPPDIARIAIAVIAIGAFFLVLSPSRPGHQPTVFTGVLTGLVAGVLTGFAAMPGPPVVPYYMRQDLPPQQVRASMMFVFFATAIAGTIASWLLGLISSDIVWFSILLFVPMLVGNWLGGLAFGRVADRTWRTIIALILAVAVISSAIRLL